ncbi:MAG: type II secretion system GspH family protein [Lachnospiraceae bacterium]|nr:type II secretion system GspH family protein [Lachnospiraceae bacterium]
MKNRGFSLVELLIIIAIMAVLSGALAPMLIRYINKSRLSTDIDSGKALATALMSAAADESVGDAAEGYSGGPHPVSQMADGAFKNAVFSVLGTDELVGKSKKDVDGNAFPHPEFYYTLDTETGKVEVYYGDTSDDYQIYPVTGSKLVDN